MENKPSSEPLKSPDSNSTNNLAGAAFRASAYLIDSLIILIISLALALPVSIVLGPNLEISSAGTNPYLIVFGLVNLIIGLIYFGYFNTSKGSTPAKSLYGIKVEELTSQSKLTYPKSFVREAIKLVIPLIPVVGWMLHIANFLFIVFSKSKQGIHDRVAKSQVVMFKEAIPLWKQVLIYVGLLFVTAVLLGLLVSKAKPNFEGTGNFMIYAWKTEFVKDCQLLGVGDERLCTCVGDNLTTKYKTTTDELYRISTNWQTGHRPTIEMEEAINVCKTQ